MRCSWAKSTSMVHRPQTKRVGCDHFNGLEDAADCKRADPVPYCETRGDIAQVCIPKPSHTMCVLHTTEY